MEDGHIQYLVLFNDNSVNFVEFMRLDLRVEVYMSVFLHICKELLPRHVSLNYTYLFFVIMNHLLLLWWWYWDMEIIPVSTLCKQFAGTLNIVLTQQNCLFTGSSPSCLLRM